MNRSPRLTAGWAASRRFRYLVVPDSVGPLTLPAVNYSYYDLTARGYRSAGTGGCLAAGGDGR